MVWEDMFRIEFDCKDELQSFDAPVLIIQGKQDIIPESLALTADSVFTNSSLVFLDQLDQRVEYLGAINTQKRLIG